MGRSVVNIQVDYRVSLVYPNPIIDHPRCSSFDDVILDVMAIDKNLDR